MSQLYFSYNMNLLKRFKHLADLFSDVPELRAEVHRLIGVVRKDKHTTEVYEEIKRDTQDHVDAIFAAKPDPVTLDRIPIFARMRLRTIFETRLHESERDTFWSTIRSAIKHGSVLSAVGSKASQMETLARDFVEQNPDLTPEQYQQAIFQQMLTGGPLAQNLLSCSRILRTSRTSCRALTRCCVSPDKILWAWPASSTPSSPRSCRTSIRSLPTCSAKSRRRV